MNVAKCSTHPLIQDKLTQLRDKNTPPFVFRKLITDIGTLLSYEVALTLEMKDVNIETPICATVGSRIKPKIGLCPVLRAGLGMVEGMLQMFPEAKVLHIGVQRDEKTLQPIEYYSKLKEMKNDRDVVFVLDPMLATAGTAKHTVALLKDWGVTNIKVVCIIACEYGIAKLHEAHPDVEIYAGAIDKTLNDVGYIVPGLGDAGDRQYF